MLAKNSLIIVSLIIFTAMNLVTFKSAQIKFERVKTAYSEKESSVLNALNGKNIDVKKLQLYIRAFKEEDILELWGKNKDDKTYQHIKTYTICEKSGTIGPKRKQGDFQVPEGYYHIDRFNAVSNFYLSLGINYPNKSDKILGVKGNLGGDIFIHGSCVTIGCLPMTDDIIKEIYIFCVEAKNNGNTTPVNIFPKQLSDKNWFDLKAMHEQDKEKIGLWEDLKKGYDYFNRTKTLPNIGFLETGRYTLN